MTELYIERVEQTLVVCEHHNFVNASMRPGSNQADDQGHEQSHQIGIAIWTREVDFVGRDGISDFDLIGLAFVRDVAGIA